MQHQYLPRMLHSAVVDCLQNFPAVAILGPRQCGKTTLAQAVISSIKNSIYLDLEKPSDLNKLTEPELFFDIHKEDLICLDEIQRYPELFSTLRSIIDERKKNAHFLILGSASRDLIKQSSESLAGRIAFLELTPFLLSEISTGEEASLHPYWLRGGFPPSYLAADDKNSFRWRENFIRTFLERDIPQLGFQIPAENLRRLWQMCAHSHGQLLNASKLGESLGVSHTTIRSYIGLLAQTFMIRILKPFEVNLKKRLVKSPKIYVRDSGILHSLLGVESYDDLMGHPVFGASWEGLVIENTIKAIDGWHFGFYRTSAGAELDLVLQKGQRRIGIECKASTAPQVTKSFWNSIEDLNIQEAWIIAPVKDSYPIKKNVFIAPLDAFISRLQEKDVINLQVK